jgi:predicted TPR repeat methyltransferase
MPVSTPVHISHCLERIIALNPQSVLDVGCGFGLWGFLCREYLDVWHGRVLPEQWQVRIDGVELFEPYIQAHQRAVYTQVFVADIRQAVEAIDAYDLIIAGDVIEHLDKADGAAVLDRLYAKTQKALLFNVPLGPGWEHPEAYGNPGELHRSQWTPEDTVQYPSEATVFDIPCGKYGVFWCAKDCGSDRRVQGLLVAAQLRESRGDAAGALQCLRQAHELEPSREDVMTALVNLLLQHGDTNGAIAALHSALRAKPEFHYGRLLLARVLAVLHRTDEAREALQALLAQDNAPDEIRTQARDLDAQLPPKR